MLGDQVEVEIQKVDVLRHQIDLAVVLPEGEEPDPDGQDEDNRYDDNRGQDNPDDGPDPFAPIPVLAGA